MCPHARGLLALPAAALVLTLLALVPGAAQAQLLAGFVPKSLDAKPAGFKLTPRAARAIADRQDAVLRERHGLPALRSRVVVPQYFGDRRYEVTYLDGEDVRVDVHVDGRSGAVLETWTGPQADNLLARGYDPPIGRALNEPYVWLGLALLFCAPFVDPRRPLRLLHLDLVVLLGFGVSQLYFNRGEIDVSVPLVYPLLAYLLVRMLAAGLRPRPAPGRLLPVAGPALLLAGLLLLVGFRVGLNLVDSHTIDVGQESVFGADRIQHGEPLYGHGAGHGDTYGPIAYLAYVPFETIFPADGPGGYDHAARAAAISFDLLVIVGLMLLGARLRAGREGRILGLALAYAWAAYPFSLYALQTNTNDSLIAALIVFAVLAASSPAGRGTLLGLAGAAKFAPLALAPLLARGRGTDGPRAVATFAALLLTTFAVTVLAYLPESGLRGFYDATVGYQLGREDPFSLWGLHPSLSVLHDLVKLGTVALAVALAFVPRTRTPRQLAALGAAVLIAVELTAVHWFYPYLVWFAPLALAAALGAYATAPVRGSGASVP